jgi:hypothetical protein
MTTARPSPAHIVLEVAPAASALLDVLVDLGHLDERLLETVNDRLLDEDPEDGVLGLSVVRRVAAQVIWEQMDSTDSDQRRVIEQEWGFLFY